MSNKYLLTGVTTGPNGTFKIAGDLTAIFKLSPQPTSFNVTNSTSFDGQYFVHSAIFNAGTGQTEISIIDPLVVSPFVAGEISNCSVYRLTTPEEDEVIIIDAQEFDTTTSLEFIGKSSEGWGETLQQNILSLLCHFSSPIPPVNPVKGQLWFDESNGLLKIWVGTWQLVNQSPAAANQIGSYTFTQTIPTMTWNVVHNLNSTNLVFNVIVDIGGGVLQSIIPATVTYTSVNELTLTFSSAREGKVAIIRAAN